MAQIAAADLANHGREELGLGERLSGSFDRVQLPTSTREEMGPRTDHHAETDTSGCTPNDTWWPDLPLVDG